MTHTQALPCEDTSVNDSDKSEPTRLSLSELEDLSSAPDLTRKEQQELKKAIRFQRRVETWEERMQGPQPRKLHRAIITLLMLAMCLFLLYLLAFTSH